MASGWRLVRWCGGPSAFEDPFIRRKIAAGGFSLGTVEALRRYEYHLRVSLSPGAARSVGPTAEFPGTDRLGATYNWSTEAPFQWMTEADAALLFTNRWDRWEFVDVTDSPTRQRAPMQPSNWSALLDDYAMLTTQTDTHHRPASGKGVVPRQLARPYR